MAHLSHVPFDDMDPELRDSMSAYDEELGGSEFVQVFAHTPEVFKNFLNYYFPLISETRDSIDMAMTELVRLKVAEMNACPL